MEAVIPDWMQQGAFGLLVVILGAIGVWLRGRLKKDADRLEKQDDWLKGLLEEDRTERAQHVATLTGMMESDIKTRKETIGTLQQINGSLEQLNESMKQNCELQEVRHGQVVAMLNNVKT